MERKELIELFDLINVCLVVAIIPEVLSLSEKHFLYYVRNVLLGLVVKKIDRLIYLYC